MVTNDRRKTARGFTLIELLVAISVSVVLLSVLAFVFQISTAATRDANSRVALTERLRSLNIRMRQEIGAILPVQRFQTPGTTFLDKRTYDIDNPGTWLVFSTATQENGRPVSVDVKYEYIPDGANPNNGILVRWRDNTGPYMYDIPTQKWLPNPLALLGDNETSSWIARTRADIMVTNVRRCVFDIIDAPPGMPVGPNGTVKPIPVGPVTELNPRELPSAVVLTIEFGAEVGNPDMLQNTTMTFPVYRGL